MDSDSWNSTRLSTFSRRHHSRSGQHSRNPLLWFIGFRLRYNESMLLQICTWRTKGAMISEQSSSALSAPRITMSFRSVATLMTTILSKPETGSVTPFPLSSFQFPIKQFCVSHLYQKSGSGSLEILLFWPNVSVTRTYVQRKRRVRKGGFGSTFSILRKELREGALQSLLGGSSYSASSNSEPDPLLSSFMFNPVVADESVSVLPCPSIEDALVKESSKDDFLERKSQQLQLSEEDQVEKARRFDFVQGLLMSTILDDKL
ncbi:Protein DEHYDRATION-INDUCED 19-like 7, partial [Mucuna pruriens]